MPSLFVVRSMKKYVFMLCQPRELNSVSANEFLTTENLMPIEINRQVKLNDD